MLSRLFTRVPVTRMCAASFSSVPKDSELYLRYKRLIYQSQQRGWLELDLIIGSYVMGNEAKLLNAKSLDELTEVCKEENSDLVRYFVEGKPVPEKWNSNQVMQDMVKYAYSPDKPWFPKHGNQ